jgi:hypothetical protein
MLIDDRLHEALFLFVGLAEFLVLDELGRELSAEQIRDRLRSGLARIEAARAEREEATRRGAVLGPTTNAVDSSCPG